MKPSKPLKIIIYRLGGSEGELQNIAKYEINAVKRGIKNLADSNYK